MHSFTILLFIVLAFLFGDTKNWRSYYPTMLFFIVGDFLYNFLLYQQPMWEFTDIFLPNHTLINVAKAAFIYPAIVLIYLGNFPKGKVKIIGWIFLWSCLLGVIEHINLTLSHIYHYNGWNLVWSMLFNVIIFVTLPIHHKRPIVAWILSIGVIITLCLIFNVDINKMK
ncbi:hypothetical protein HNQ94_001563 [Salirhabdus euzebyi]|uniref:Uncharacterized protein n=1 Tax=Salirhabdus euzebyi TaxID=394506 RepID=A0A841Q403_9BACI|nr:CBO0543 family protein [Salirhabdus euzebyi]MBB6453115.1 hypothetical protein [Salirhabdus euzebyi]